MATYQSSLNGCYIRTSDGAFIPNDPNNRDFQVVQAWIAAGGTPDPYTPPVSTTVSYAVLRGRLTDSERTNILTACRNNTQIQDFVLLGAAYGGINLTTAMTAAAKAALVSAKLLTQARADAIFVP